MYVIIVGCGRLGARLALDLSADNHDVVVIDKEEASFDRLGTGFNGMTVLGTGIDADVLKKGGIEQADVLIALTDQDNVNIMVAQVAKDIFAVPKVIARVYDPEREYAYKEFGLETINPTEIGLTHIKSAVTPSVLHRYRLPSHGYGDIELVEIKIDRHFAGRNFDAVQIPHKFRIFGVLRGTETLIPNGDLVLAAGDIVLGVVRIDALGTLEDLLNESEG